MTQDYLEHYGKKGMKWGVRKARIKKGVKKAVKYQLGQTDQQKQARAEAKATASRVAQITKTKVSSLNNPKSRASIKKGAGMVGKILGVAGKVAVSTYATSEIMGQLTKIRPITATSVPIPR